MYRWACCAALCGALELLASQAMAQKSAVGVLNFGGGNAGQAVRSVLVRALNRQYRVVDGQEILAACDSLGIQISRGANLTRIAEKVGVFAVVGGAVANGTLTVAVYSAKTGDVVSTGKVPHRGARMNPKTLRKALSLLGEGLRQASGGGAEAPAGGELSNPEPAPPPAPPPPGPAPGGPSGGGGSTGGGSLEFEPEEVQQSGGSSAGGSSLQSADPSHENPLSSTPPLPGLPLEALQALETKKPANEQGSPRIAGTVGFGVWMRNLNFNDAINLDKRDASGNLIGTPTYKSGAAFSMAGELRVRPIAFFTDGFARNFYSRLRLQGMVGLKSRLNEGGPVDATSSQLLMSTSLLEFLWEIAGYDWKLLSSPQSPHLETSVGFGLMSFKISWPTETTTGTTPTKRIPDTSYKFFLASLGAYTPLFAMIGARLRFDYRVVTSAGQIEEQAQWFGPSSTGGIGLQLGLTGFYRGFVGSLDYGYTRYFYAFKEASQRTKECPSGTSTCQYDHIAGGALDTLHSVMVNIGYSF